jgi:hypothetical protein
MILPEKLRSQGIICENKAWESKERNGLMAKARMICPFSGVICKDCPLYRGRHYLLCFCEKYRGYLTESGKIPPALRTGSNGKFIMPSLPTAKKDPYINEML